MFFNLREANTNDSINAIAEEIMPEITAHTDGINLNAELFARIKTVYDNQDKENLTTEQKMVLKNITTTLFVVVPIFRRRQGKIQKNQ